MGLKKKIFALILLVHLLGIVGLANASSPLPKNDTLLMFVGEPLEVLTIASRRKESAWQAPAIANVVTRNQFQQAGMTTLGEALSLVPGFFMAQKEWGVSPYLRGVSNSILLLMDMVPLGSDMAKSLNVLDGEVSLSAVKRIEVVRGPGSVLLGPDAFAGIVNVVPMTGKDLNGTEVGALYSAPGDHIGTYTNFGYESGKWDLFGSLSVRKDDKEQPEANVVRFWETENTPVPVENRFGESVSKGSEFLEGYARLNYNDWLNLSGRFSHFNREYTLTSGDGLYSWGEERKTDSGFLKLESKRTLGISSALRVLASYSWLNPDHRVIDRYLSQTEDSLYGEILYDLSVLAGRGLLTSGFSYREKHIRNAPVWDGYLIDFLGPENEFFVPGFTKKDYDSRLLSYFGQYVHKINDVDLLLGIRFDDHEQYEDKVSFNIGTVWSPSSDWVFKLFYGSAYRTPFARQLRADNTPNLEKSSNMSAQVAWKSGTGFRAAACVFNNRIEDHVMEDPYAGLSEPNSQDVRGIELEIQLVPVKQLEITSTFTFFDNQGKSESYKFNDFNFIRPDGTVEKHFIDIFYPYDSGADKMLNLSVLWKANERMDLFGRLRYHSGYSLVYPRNENSTNFSGVWLVDVTATFKKVLIPQMEWAVSFKNLMDENYKIPGTYNIIEGDPFRFQFEARIKW